MCRVWLCMNEMSEHLNSFFHLNFFHLSSFLTNTKCKCHAPSHADECHDRSYQCNMRLLCHDMPLINSEPLTYTVYLFCECKHFIKSRCDASLDFLSLTQKLPTKMQMFIWCTCLLTNMQMQISMMQMSHYKDANATSLWCKFPMQGCTVYSWWCKCPLVGMSWCKCFLLDANAI